MFLSISGSVAAEEPWSSGRATPTRVNRRRSRRTLANTVAAPRGIERLYRWSLPMTSRQRRSAFRTPGSVPSWLPETSDAKLWW
jgi:hypothetical protein